MQCGRCIGIGKGQEFKDNINVRTIGAVWRGPRAVRTIVWQRLVFAIIGFWKFDVVNLNLTLLHNCYGGYILLRLYFVRKIVQLQVYLNAYSKNICDNPSGGDGDGCLLLCSMDTILYL